MCAFTVQKQTSEVLKALSNWQSKYLRKLLGTEINTHMHMVNMYIKHLGCKITHNITLRSSTFQQYGIQPANLDPTHSLDS